MSPTIVGQPLGSRNNLRSQSTFKGLTKLAVTTSLQFIAAEPFEVDPLIQITSVAGLVSVPTKQSAQCSVSMGWVGVI